MKLILLLVIFSNLAYSGTLADLLVNEVPDGCKLIKETKFKERKFLIRHAMDCGSKKSYVYIDNHKVRTMNEVLMIQITNDLVDLVKPLQFYEPPEYKPKKRWLARLRGRNVDRMKFGEDLDSISGATLTYNAVVDNVAKVLRIHHSFKDGSKQ